MTTCPARRRAPRVGPALALALFVTAACGGAATHERPDGDPSPDPEREPDAAAVEAGVWSAELEVRSGASSPLVPVGYGTLSRDEITVSLRADDLQIKFVPLTEWVIRLTAPDTHRRLQSYKVGNAEEILRETARAGERGWPTVALVTFFSHEVEESFEPQDLQVNNQSRRYRPLDVIGITPGFGRERLDQQETQVALYLFSAEIDLDLPTEVRYGDTRSDRWNSIRSTLDSERSRANSRAGPGRP